MKHVLHLLLLLLIMFVSCSEGRIQQETRYSVPVGFEEFVNCKATYRVFASDSVFYIKIKALMTAYIDTANSKLVPSTVFKLIHSSGDTLTIETSNKLMSYEDFRTFVNSHKAEHKDTVVHLIDNYMIRVVDQSYNLEKLEIPFAFLDVSFKGYPALLIRKGVQSQYNIYDVYGISSTGIRKVDYAPYNGFKTATSSWMLGYGTEINYKKKEIIVPSLSPESCSDYGTMIYDHYVLNQKTDKFDHYRKTKKYYLER